MVGSVNNYQPRAPHPGRPAVEPRRTTRSSNVMRQVVDPWRRNPHRGTDRTVAPQPHPIPAAGHRRARSRCCRSPRPRPTTERLLVISPELADVLSHHRRPHPRRPARRAAGGVLRQERTRLQPAHAAAVPMAATGCENRPVAETALRTYLDHALTAIGVKDAAGEPMRYTFHDFRRLFITDAIVHGMPPHIAQLVAGHRDINTTMGYKAVYPEEVINGHRAFIARRRALRPSEEYRTPTDEEWAEFVGHFERRKVAVGDCGRSYDTPCIHEHSCLRCRCCAPTPPPATPRKRSATTSSPASPKPNPTAGTARPRASRSASPAPTPNSPRWTGVRPPPLSTSACPTHNTRKPHGRNTILSSEKPGSPDPGSTTSRNCAPKSSASEPGDTLRHRTPRSRTGNAPPTPPCSSGCRPLPSASSICRAKTDSSVRRSPTPSVSSAPTPFAAIAATRRQQNLPPSSAPADHASKTPSSTHSRWSEPRPCNQLQITSGLFAANCAWLACAVITHNLLRAAGTIAGGEHAVARGATLRRDLVTVPARFAAPARKPMLHLPAHWPWQIGWKTLWDNITGYSPAIPRAG